MSEDAFPARLAARARAAGVEIPAPLSIQLETYFHLLLRWNFKINLTALSLDPLTDQAIDRLFIEPLTALPFIRLEAPLWIDLGSGGGSPAIPMKLARPAFRLRMVESRERKAAFLREVARTLGLKHALVDARRIEEVATNHRSSAPADLITVRAVRIDSGLFDAIRILLKVGGQVILFGARSDGLSVPAGFELDAQPPASASRPFDIIVLCRNRP